MPTKGGKRKEKKNGVQSSLVFFLICALLCFRHAMYITAIRKELYKPAPLYVCTYVRTILRVNVNYHLARII